MSYCSLIRVTHGGSILLDFGDKVESPFSIDGQQIVDSVNYFRSASVTHIPRGNESHTVSWTRSERNIGRVQEGIRDVLDHSTLLSRESDDLLIEVNDNDTRVYVLRGAVIESWSSAGGLTRDSRSINILGGELVTTEVLGGGSNGGGTNEEGSNGGGTNWEDANVNWENVFTNWETA